MKSLTESILGEHITNESILSSTKTGSAAIREKIDDWLKNQGLPERDYVINPDMTVTIGPLYGLGNKFEISGDIPDYIKIVDCAPMLTIIEPTLLNNLPLRSSTLRICYADIKDFTDFNIESCKRLCLSACDIRSLKGFPKNCDEIIIGDNIQHFSKKKIAKLVNTKPNNIYNIGSFDDLHIVLGEHDYNYIETEMQKLEALYRKTIPELDHIAIPALYRGNLCIYFVLDFLSSKDHPYGISENSIYLEFRYNLGDQSLDLCKQGSIDLTPEDKAGKYKYQALKGFTTPYTDNGGKKFRKIRLYDFTADIIYDKTKDWVKAVVDAAIEDNNEVFNKYKTK